MSYVGPVNSLQFLLKYGCDLETVLDLPKYSDFNLDLITDILNGAASFCEDVLAPTNRAGDLTPARLDGDNVIASPGFKGAYHAFVDAGWLGLSMDNELGGMGLPQLVSVATNEMIYSANMALGLCPMLTSSAVKAIDAHAEPVLKAKYLDKMVTGEWTGAMCLTEPQAGSDLGPVRTKAEPNGDGTFAISGQKIFITWGDHDCADNIIHLVLARLPDAPSGSKGISLFLCPKFLVDDNGDLGNRNNFKAISLEHKLGIHGSPTCVMDFAGATGWLVGEINRGLSCMFTMMNEARLFVGVQGVAIGERAYQAALDFSRERVQGRAINAEPGAPIIAHPDVRRNLIDMKARLMAARAICMATAQAGDIGAASPDADTVRRAHAKEALLTPMAKSNGSDTGVDIASIGVQIHGGMGFIEETGAAQHYRDSRIAPIYEGTNGIQAIDLVGRKIRRDGGEAMRDLLDELEQISAFTQQAAEGNAELAACGEAVQDGIVTLALATDAVLGADEADLLSIAAPFQSLASDIIGGAFLIKAAAKGTMAQDDRAANMTHLAHYYATVIMPRGKAHLPFVQSRASSIFDFPESQLADL